MTINNVNECINFDVLDEKISKTANYHHRKWARASTDGKQSEVKRNDRLDLKSCLLFQQQNRKTAKLHFKLI